MNNSRFLRCLIVPALLLVGCRIVPCAPAAPPPGYYLVWNDEFNEASLDTTRWDYWLLGPRRDAVNVTNAISLTGSNLVITTCTVNGTNYTGMLASDQTFRSRYGYWEASLKWGDTNGMWSAFWFQSPTMGTYLPDPVVSGSEIDDAEHRSVDGSGNNIANQVQVNIHWNGYGSAARSTGSGNVGSGLAASFHTYGFLWTPNAYTFLIDGATVYNGGSAPVSRSTEWPILSSEVDDTSTTWAGYIPSGGYGSPANSTTKLTVDYVRYYAPTNTLFWTGAGDATYLTNAANYIATLPPLAASDVTFSYLSGNNLSPTLGGDMALDGLVFLNLKNGASLNGTDTLTLGPGGVDMTAANHSVNLNCPIRIGAAQTWSVGPNNPGNTLTLNGSLSGAGTLTKAGYGALILNGSDSFSGILNVDTGSTTASDGILRIANPAALAGVASPIAIRNNNSGSSTLQLDGAAGNLTLSQDINLCGRNTNVVAIETVAGNNTLSGNLNLVVGGGNYWLQSDIGTLTLAGAVPASTPGGSRTLSFLGNGNFIVSGPLQNGTGGGTVNVVKSGNGYLTLTSPNNSLSGNLTITGGFIQVGDGVSDSSLGAATVTNNATLLFDTTGTVTVANPISGAGSLIKNDAGTLTLSGVDTCSGPTRVNAGTLLVNGQLGASSVTVNGTLGGGGVIHGPVTIQPGAVLSPGLPQSTTVATFTISNSLSLAGTAFIKLDATAGTNDVIRGLSSVTYGGTLAVTNLAGTPTAGDSFKIFDAANYRGSFATLDLPPLGTGLAWDTNALTNGVLSVVLRSVAPRISGLSLVGTNLILAGSGGATGYGYSVLFSTNLVLPLTQWRVVGSNNFDSAGQFFFTNELNPNLGQGFYAIQIP